MKKIEVTHRLTYHNEAVVTLRIPSRGGPLVIRTRSRDIHEAVELAKLELGKVLIARLANARRRHLALHWKGKRG